MGITARTDEQNLIIGKQDFLKLKGAQYGEEVLKTIGSEMDLGRTAILVSSGTTVAGIIAIVDENIL